MDVKNIKDTLNLIRNDGVPANSFCKCERKIIRKPLCEDDKVFYCELCNLPILQEDRNKIIDDWRHIQLKYLGLSFKDLKR